MTTSVSHHRFALPVVLAAAILATAVSRGSDGATAPGGRMAAVLQPFVNSHTLAGAVVLVADKDKVLDVEAVGYADVAAKKPMQTDCVFWIASQSKPITADRADDARGRGQGEAGRPGGEVPAGVQGADGRRRARQGARAAAEAEASDHVRNVLSHTSGLPFTSPIEKPTLDLFPLECRVRSYAMLPLEFEPDTKNMYANAGINIAGRIIEVVSGMPFEKFLDQRLFKPLGMKDTTFWPTAEQLGGWPRRTGLPRTISKSAASSQLKYPLDDPQRQPMPAGGLFSTAADLCLFYRMIANGGVFAGKAVSFRAGAPRNGNAATGQSELRPWHAHSTETTSDTTARMAPTRVSTRSTV